MESNLSKKRYEHLPLGVSGLGGWLVLPHIGLYGTILASCLIFFQSIVSINSDAWWVLTSTHSPYYHPLWATVLIYETIYSFAIAVFSTFILVNFYRKKSMVPRLMIIFLSVSLMSNIIDYLLVIQIPLAEEMDKGTRTLKAIMRSVLGCIIWIPYFLNSVRVRNTFVN